MKGKKAAGGGVGGGGTTSKRGRKPGIGAPGKKAVKKRVRETSTLAVERPARERKTVERFSDKYWQKAVATEAVLSIPQGSGTRLKDIPNVFFKLSKRRADDNLQLLHTILFAKKAKAFHLKRNIYQFSGFAWTENEERRRAKVKEKLDKCVKDKLFDFCDILDIPVSKATIKKEEMSAKLLEFLESPHVTRATVLADKEQKGRKRKRTKGFSEATSHNADSDRETKKQKKNNESSAKKKRRKHTGMETSDNEINETEHEGDEPEPVGEKNVSTQKQKNKGPKTMVRKVSPAKSAKISPRFPPKKKKRALGKSKNGSSMEQTKRGSRASVKRKDGPTRKDSHKLKKHTSDSRNKDKKNSQPEPTVSAKKQGKGRASGEVEPTREELLAVARDILKAVDFDTVSIGDVLKQLGSQFGVDLMPREAEVKGIIAQVMREMTVGVESNDGSR